MAENDQHLKHGKALCGKVFGRFVETFNALVDFMLGIKGDADGKNGEGHITYDRENNIIRCDGCGGNDGSGSGVTANEKSGLTVDEGEIDISGREDDDAFGIHTMTVKGDGENEEDKTVKFIGTDDVEIKPVPKNFGPHTLKVKTGEGEDDKKEYQILAAEDVEIETKPKTDCVESLNGETGDLEITGGHKVNVSKDGKTIVVSLDESKEDPKPDPNTNCGDHPGSEEGGGVIVGPAGGGGSGAGVPAEGGAGSSGVGCDC